MKKIILVLIALSISIANAKTQSSSDSMLNDNEQNLLGVNLGSTTGLGISYIRCFNNNQLQVTFMPLIDKKNTYYSLGLTYMHVLKNNQNSAFFLYLGNHLTNLFSNNELSYNIGIGPGVQYELLDFTFHIMVGYGAYNITTDFMTRPAGEWGVFYRF